MAQLHTLSVLVENKFGVLARVTSLVSRRGYNIESLAVAPTDDPQYSRITIVVDADSTPMDQIVKQLNKLINVIDIIELSPEDSVARELLLISVTALPERRAEIAVHAVLPTITVGLVAKRRAIDERPLADLWALA